MNVFLLLLLYCQQALEFLENSGGGTSNSKSSSVNFDLVCNYLVSTLVMKEKISLLKNGFVLYDGP